MSKNLSIVNNILKKIKFNNTGSVHRNKKCTAALYCKPNKQKYIIYYKPIEQTNIWILGTQIKCI